MAAIDLTDLQSYIDATLADNEDNDAKPLRVQVDVGEGQPVLIFDVTGIEASDTQILVTVQPTE